MKLKVKNLEVSMINITLILYLFGVIVTDEGSNFMKVIRVVMLGVCLVITLKEKKIRLYKYFLPLILFCLFAILSIKWACNKALSLEMSKTLVINVITIYCFFYLVNFNKKRIDLVLKSIMIFPILLELRAIYYGGIFGYLNSRISGTISGNTVGMCSAFGASIALYYILKKNKTSLYITLFITNIMILILSSSRKAILCLLIPVGVLYVFNNKNRLLNIIFKLIVLSIITIGVYYLIINIEFLYNTIGHRMESLINGLIGNGDNIDASAKTRMNLITWGLEWFKENKWIGYGVDNYRVMLTTTHPDYPISYYAHNNYVELLVDLGIVGTVLYYFNYIKIIFIGFIKKRKMSNCGLVFIGILIAILISETGLVSYYDKYIQMMLASIWIVVKSETNKNLINYNKE